MQIASVPGGGLLRDRFSHTCKTLITAWEIPQDYARHGGREKYENERAALLGDRHPSAGSSMPGGSGGGTGAMDPESQMAMQRSHQALDELEERGMAMLGEWFGATRGFQVLDICKPFDIAESSLYASILTLVCAISR